MEKRELTCIGCPMGCNLLVELDGDQVVSISGYTCKRGEEYGRKECTNPTRILTSSVSVAEGENDVVPVKTESDIPKNKLFDCVKVLKNVTVKAPVKIGDVIVEDIEGTGVNIIATKNVNRK